MTINNLKKKCSDERPCINCFSDQGECLGHHKATSFKEASEPLIKWLAKNVHPHHAVIVTATGAELMEGEISHQTTEFLKD